MNENTPPNRSEDASAARRREWWTNRSWKLYRNRNGGTLYLRLRSRDRKYLIVKFWTHTYGSVKR